MTVVNYDTYDYTHNGEKIVIDWWLDRYEVNEFKNEYTERIQFEYKDVPVVHLYTQGKSHWWNVTDFMCNIIDKIGKEKFNKFKEYYKECELLNEEYIILNNNIYKPYINDTLRSGQLIHYIVEVEMEDGKRLDGRTNIDQRGMNRFDREEHNKDELINTLRYRVKEYLKNENKLPKKEYLLEEETQKYNKILQWLDKNRIKDYVLNFI